MYGQAITLAATGSCSFTFTNPGTKTLTAIYEGDASFNGGSSAAVTHTVNNLVPSITSLNPSSSTAGGIDFTLMVMGTNFFDGSVVRWNGSNRSTSFVSETQLRAAIMAGDIAAAGTASVTVAHPLPGGDVSNPLTTRSTR